MTPLRLLQIEDGEDDAVLPVDELKIDFSFVLGLSEGEDDTLVRCLIDLAHNLGLRVVAEGVETLEVCQQLTELGCDAAQGYYISQPGPPKKSPNGSTGSGSSAPRRPLPGSARRARGRRTRGARHLQTTPPINYALEVMPLVHHAHRSHHHRSQNGTAGVCA